jgi:hypothetical protein
MHPLKRELKLAHPRGRERGPGRGPILVRRCPFANLDLDLDLDLDVVLDDLDYLREHLNYRDNKKLWGGMA